MQISATARETRYCLAIRAILMRVGHATNAELLSILRLDYPAITATTVHRATTRLAARGEISYAPPAANGAARFDANTAQHDHFMCQHCHMLRDVRVPKSTAAKLQALVPECTLSGGLTISGLCHRHQLSADVPE